MTKQARPTQEQIDTIVRLHKPRGWKLDAKGWRRGVASPATKTISCADLTTDYGLQSFLHECGHVHLGHFKFDPPLPHHVEEYQAERYSWGVLDAWGFPHSESLKVWGRAYIRSWIKKDRAAGVPIDPKIEEWANGKQRRTM